MKTILSMLLSLILCLGASAQLKGYHVYRHVYRPHVYIAPFSYGLGFGYPYYGFPYNNNYGYRQMPYKLELQIETIKEDYQNRIKAARRDKSLGHSKRRQAIRTLKSERDREIINAKKEYTRRPPVTNNGNQYNEPG